MLSDIFQQGSWPVSTILLAVSADFQEIEPSERYKRMKKLRILHLEDNPKYVELAASTLAGEGIEAECTHVQTLDEFLVALKQGGVDLILADSSQPFLDSREALKLTRREHPDLPFILLSGTAGEHVVADALKSGATDHVLKRNLSLLPFAVKRAVQRAQEQAEGKEAVRELQHMLEFEQLIASISTRFINLASREIDSSIQNALAQIGEFTGIDRAYIFQFSEDSTRMENTYEWCADGIKSHKEERKAMPVEKFRWALERLKRSEILHIARVAELPPEAGELIPELERSHVKSLIALPMVYQNSLIGFLGLSSVRQEKAWPENIISLLGIAGEIFLNALKRKEIVSLEEQLRQAQKMEAIGQLAAGIAHDFNNLIMAISVNCQLLLIQVAEDNPLRSHIEEIRKSSDLAATLTRQLLAFGKKQVLDLRRLNLNDVVSGMQSMLQRLLGEDIELSMHLHEKLDLILADYGQMEQILINLAVNSRDAMAQGGQLVIRTAHVELDKEYAAHHVDVTSGHFVMLSVTDTGCGMDESTRSHIFEPFFTTKGKGTGLGLSTVYGIVKQTGGHIFVYSEVGMGTTFKIYFPRIQDAAAEEQPSETTIIPMDLTGSQTILIVDDHESVRKAIASILEFHGYRVLQACHGRQALEKSIDFRERIHLLITDVVMPQMSGWLLAKHLTESNQELKVLFISGFSEEIIHRDQILAADSAFLQKPVAMITLLRKVRELLE